MQRLKREEFSGEWCLVDTGFSEENAKYYEGLFTQGNGYMHVRGSFDEGIASVDQALEYERKPANVTIEKHQKTASKWGTFVPGVVGKHPYLNSEIINLPFFFKTEFEAEGESLDMGESCISEYERYVDMRDGSLSRSFKWTLGSGCILSFEFFRYLSITNRHLAFSEIRVKAEKGDAELAFRAGMDGGVRTNGFNHYTALSASESEDSVSLCVDTNGGSRVVMSSKLFADREMSLSVEKSDSAVYSAGKVLLREGEVLTLRRAVAVCSTEDYDLSSDKSEGPGERTRSLLAAVTEESFYSNYEEHKAEWRTRWDMSDIQIKGDDDTQKALRFSMYHLLRADNNENPGVAICAKGYAGEAYFGKYFWDTEISMLPFFIYTDPMAGRNLLMFRYNTLQGAKRNAAAYGYRGARYPWESSVTGDEECACWQYADHEIHVTADIVYAIMHYVKATGDEEFVRDFGIDVMVETARYWIDRVDVDSEGRYVLLGVMGPDEYLPTTQNNAYTNHMVKYALDSTLEYIDRFRSEGVYGPIKDRLQLEDSEIEQMREVAGKIKIAFDRDTEIILQCDEFMSYADIDFDDVWKDRSKCFGQFVSQERNYRSKALKQADVLEMMMLFPEEFSREQFVSNYDFYEPITTHDSSLSAAVHGAVASWIGREDEALSFLSRVRDIDLCPERLGAEEGIHIANCGGLWQMVVLGFAGMKTGLQADRVVFEPHLPVSWESVRIPVIFRGERHIYEVSHSGVTAV